MSTCNQLDLQTLGSQLVIMPQNLPNHWCVVNLRWGNTGDLISLSDIHIHSQTQSCTHVTVAMHDLDFSCCQDRDSMQIQRPHYCMASSGRLKRIVNDTTQHLVRSHSIGPWNITVECLKVVQGGSNVDWASRIWLLHFEGPHY